MDLGPQPGDMIEIFRPLYQHWAVYVGNGNVVHLSTTDGVVRDSLASVSTRKAVVRKDRLSDACGRDLWKVNNKYDNHLRPRNAEEIVRSALSWVGKNVRYSVLNCNCEHFATFLRYDQPESRQAFFAGLSLFLAAALGFLLR